MCGAAGTGRLATRADSRVFTSLCHIPHSLDRSSVSFSPQRPSVAASAPRRRRPPLSFLGVSDEVFLAAGQLPSLLWSRQFSIRTNKRYCYLLIHTAIGIVVSMFLFGKLLREIFFLDGGGSDHSIKPPAVTDFFFSGHGVC